MNFISVRFNICLQALWICLADNPHVLAVEYRQYGEDVCLHRRVSRCLRLLNACLEYLEELFDEAVFFVIVYY